MLPWWGGLFEAGSSLVRLGPALFKVQPCLTWRCIRHAWQAWQRTAWSCVTCLEVAEDGPSAGVRLGGAARRSGVPVASELLGAGGG